MKTTEFMDRIQEYSISTILLAFMSIGLIAAGIAVGIVYAITKH
jgi:hypothetical protein